MKYIQEEKRVLVGKEIKIKTLSNPLIGRARRNTIEVSENLKEYLGKEGYQQILLHEAGHLRDINAFLLNLSSIIFILSVFFIVLNNSFAISYLPDILNFYFWFIPMLFILQLFCYWTIEILADKFAIENTGNFGNYEKTLKKVYKHPGYPGNNGWFYRNIKHPPKKIRFRFIRKFIKNRKSKKGEVRLRRK